MFVAGPLSEFVRLGWEPPKVLCPHWRIDTVLADGIRYVRRLPPMRAIVSVSKEYDGRRWVHLSLSHRDRLPTWRELRDAKEMFLGDVYAYQVLPIRERYVNTHPNVLHLWHCLDENPLPDFTRGTGSI